MRHIVCHLLAAALLIALLAPVMSPGLARADDWGTLMTPTRPLNVRLDRSPKAGKVKTLRPGDVVRVDFLKDGWYAVFDPQETERDVAKALGYSKASYLKPASGSSSVSASVSAPGEWGEILVVTAPMLNVRTGRGPKYQHVRTLYEGDLVKVDFAAGNWVAVFEPDASERKESAAIGYTNGKYLKPPTQAQLAALADKADADEETSKPQPQSQSQVEARPEPLPVAGSEWGEIMRLSSKVQILQEPDSGAKVVATLLVGDVIKVLKVSGDWYRAYLPQEMDPDPVHALGWVTQEQLGDTGREVTAESITAAVQEPAPLPEPGPEPEVVPEPAIEPEPAVEPEPAATDGEKVNPILEQMAQDDARTDTTQTDDVQEDAVNTVREQADTNPLPQLDESGEPGQAEEAAVWDEDAPSASMQDAQEQGEALDTATSTFTASAEAAPQEYEITVPEYVEGEPQQGREPVADKEAHGFQYAVLAKSGTEPFAKTMTIGVYLDVTVVPGADSLRDFAATVWKKEGKSDKNVVVDIFLPGQDLRSLSYVTATFDTRGPVEFWTRETTLYGTRFK